MSTAWRLIRLLVNDLTLMRDRITILEAEVKHLNAHAVTKQFKRGQQ